MSGFDMGLVCVLRCGLFVRMIHLCSPDDTVYSSEYRNTTLICR